MNKDQNKINHKNRIQTELDKIRKNKPLIHNITNFVATNFNANALLAIGASPVMAHSKMEAADMASFASSLVLNIGTLEPHWIEGMELAIAKAKERNIPIVLDPVGNGATPYRTQTVEKLVTLITPAIIRGNASEIGTLVGNKVEIHGVDSVTSGDSTFNAAHRYAKKTGNTIVISGAVDFISDGTNQAKITGGSPLMTFVTATGCTATAIVGAFAAVAESPFLAALDAMAIMSTIGSLAAKTAKGPGSMVPAMLDSFYSVDAAQVVETVQIDIL